MPTRTGSTAMKRRLLMFARAFLSIILLLSTNSVLCSAVEQRMEIRDLSDRGSPIQISGRMMIGYDSANQFPFSCQKSLSIKNISTRSILLMVVHVEATSGPDRDEHFSEEYFFGNALAPGELDVRDFPEQRFGTTVVNGEPIPYTKDPHPAAQAQAEFVQFSDGSTWGDADAARNVFEIRRRTLAELDRLEHIYEQAGESAFLDKFVRSDDFLNVIRQLQEGCGEQTAANCAHNAVHRTFVVAKKHEEATTSGAGRNGQ